MGAQNRVAIVTGASKGIGRATTFALVQQGIHVLAVARSTHLLDKLVMETASLPGKLIIAYADITQRDKVEAAVKQALEYFGHIDVLVNNAGVELVKPVETVSDDEYAATMDTNLKGLFYFTRAVVLHMKRQGSGLIINISSTAGHRGFAEDAIYCASKFGVVGFSDALDEELRKFGIRICCISPGAVNTELAKDTWCPPERPLSTAFSATPGRGQGGFIRHGPAIPCCDRKHHPPAHGRTPLLSPPSPRRGIA